VSSGRVAVLQSSAAVHRGCSGGALVDVARGTLVGMVTTNVKQQDGAIMPHVNFSLPTDLLRPLLDFVGAPPERQSTEALRRAWDACAADEYEQTLWRLEPEVLDLPSLVEERKRQALRRLDELANEGQAAEEGVFGEPPAESAPSSSASKKLSATAEPSPAENPGRRAKL